jgi:hypothetical protein
MSHNHKKAGCNLALGGGQKVAFILWLSKNEERCTSQTARQIAEAAESDLGFHIYPHLAAARRKPASEKVQRWELDELKQELKHRMDRLEQKLGLFVG